MNSQVIGLRVGSVIFGLVSLGHLLRMLAHVEILIASYVVPQWPSAVAFVISGLLSLWMWKLSCSANK